MPDQVEKKVAAACPEWCSAKHGKVWLPVGTVCPVCSAVQGGWICAGCTHHVAPCEDVYTFARGRPGMCKRVNSGRFCVHYQGHGVAAGNALLAAVLNHLRAHKAAARFLKARLVKCFVAARKRRRGPLINISGTMPGTLDAAFRARAALSVSRSVRPVCVCRKICSLMAHLCFNRAADVLLFPCACRLVCPCRTDDRFCVSVSG